MRCRMAEVYKFIRHLAMYGLRYKKYIKIASGSVHGLWTSEHCIFQLSYKVSLLDIINKKCEVWIHFSGD